ncbi:MAG: sporulation protein [Sphingomonadales bacterium]|nr:sporulation protein [Sphingomonadales bacterium]MBU3993348.1 SEL1-like repeat protein [Alphaproteobacteria bacterium]
MAGVRWILGCVAGTVLAAGTSALADVKAGTEAWARSDYAAAIREWQGPAATGDPDAQFNLAQAYRLGRGVERDLARAELLFGKAAAQGHMQAADNYGLLLFDRGERRQALPYVQAAAGRGDPRAQYLLGIAHFNGDLLPKDWIRAYALMSLARTAGLAQAEPAMAQMDQHIPLAQRQAAVSLAARLGQQVEANRASQIAASRLGVIPGATAASTPPEATVQTAGADYARPAAPAQAIAVATTAPKPAPKPVAKPPHTGIWRVQLGAFGVPGNADALWAKAARRPELAGHPRIDVKVGKVVKLQAGGFASSAAASTACAALTRGGYSCIPARD